MNQEKKEMQTLLSAGEYLAPRVKVVEVKVRRAVLGGSTYDPNGSFTNAEQEGD